jgi:hypothetical protein
MMIGMRSMGRSGSPNRDGNPGKSRDNHIYDGTNHKDLKRAVPITEVSKEKTEYAIVAAEEKPRD